MVRWKLGHALRDLYSHALSVQHPFRQIRLPKRQLELPLDSMPDMPGIGTAVEVTFQELVYLAANSAQLERRTVTG